MAYIIAIFPSPDNAKHAPYEFGAVKELTIARSIILFRNDNGTFIFDRSLGAAPAIIPAELRLEPGQFALIAELHERYPATTAMIVRSNGGTLARIADDSDLPKVFAAIPDVTPLEPPPPPTRTSAKYH